MVKNYLAKVRANQMSAHKGFTLVELIVVIVILAILVGVTIGGIYMYVGKSKVNTDKNNASSIVSVCGTANADAAVYTALTDNAQVTFTWTNAQTIAASDSGVTFTAKNTGGTAATKGESNNAALEKAIGKYLVTVLPDGLPEAQTGKAFTLTFKVQGTGDAKSLSVTCTQAE